MLAKVSLFYSKKERLTLLLALFTLAFVSLNIDYYHYKEFTKFDSVLLDALVLKQYTKKSTTSRGNIREYQVLKLKSRGGVSFYTIASKKFPLSTQRVIEIEIWAGDISFYEYLRTFFAFGSIKKVYEDESLKRTLSKAIEQQHREKNIADIYKALYLATPLEWELQKRISTLGISHLIAISGFHLGVLSTLLFLLIKYPYKFLQNRFFPYRSYKRDSFAILALLLLGYLLFLDAPPSLLRAYAMLIVGFVLYDRGIKIISMQSLLLSVLILLALWIKLLFSLGFWLSVAGVFYIFLFLIYFKERGKLEQFLLLPFWIYLMMLPLSVVLFGNFSLIHPLSILYSSLFSLFYPLSILLHLLGKGNLLDGALVLLLNQATPPTQIELSYYLVLFELFISFLAIYFRAFFYLLILFCSSFFIYSIYNVA